MSWTMAVNEKILRSLKSAVTYLENSVSALDKKDEGLLADSVWHVAAELEYTLFLLSIKTQNESDAPKLKSNLEFKKADADSMLVEVKNLLNQTEEFVLSGRLQDAYKSAYAARHRVLKIKEDIAKKKREVPREK
jgi:hypothetical protein